MDYFGSLARRLDDGEPLIRERKCRFETGSFDGSDFPIPVKKRRGEIFLRILK